MKRVFICSRYAGDVKKNVETAKRLCRKATGEGLAPFAPHLLYTLFLNDDEPEEKLLGLECGKAFLDKCDELWFYIGDGVSANMRHERDHALNLGIPVRIVEKLIKGA